MVLTDTVTLVDFFDVTWAFCITIFDDFRQDQLDEQDFLHPALQGVKIALVL